MTSAWRCCSHTERNEVIEQSSFDRSTHCTHPGWLHSLIFVNTFSTSFFNFFCMTYHFPFIAVLSQSQTIQYTNMCLEVEISSTAFPPNLCLKELDDIHFIMTIDRTRRRHVHTVAFSINGGDLSCICFN